MHLQLDLDYKIHEKFEWEINLLNPLKPLLNLPHVVCRKLFVISIYPPK
jgi:hypothetical protein